MIQIFKLQQQAHPEGTSSSTYANKNVINSETPYINAKLQFSETTATSYVNVAAFEVQ